MEKINDKSWDRETIELCPILFQVKQLSPAKSNVLSFGFECDYGWKLPLHKMSCRLEALNLLYWPKWRVRVQLMQVKEKFGMLCAYTDIHVDGNGFRWWLNGKLYKLYDAIRRLDYKPKQVIDRDYWTEHEIVMLPKDVWLKEKERQSKFSNVAFKEEDGKFMKQVSHQHCPMMHYEPTRLKLMKNVERAMHWLACLSDGWATAYTSEQEVIVAAVASEVSKIVADAERECKETCEICGSSIGSRLSPCCETVGYIKRICRDCAKAGGSNYIMDGELWNGETLLKTREERQKQCNNES